MRKKNSITGLVDCLLAAKKRYVDQYEVNEFLRKRRGCEPNHVIPSFASDEYQKDTVSKIKRRYTCTILGFTHIKKIAWIPVVTLDSGF